jgi:heme/copper-type cytochrome/quinol oxidase subunit 3
MVHTWNRLFKPATTLVALGLFFLGLAAIERTHLIDVEAAVRRLSFVRDFWNRMGLSSDWLLPGLVALIVVSLGIWTSRSRPVLGVQD